MSEARRVRYPTIDGKRRCITCRQEYDDNEENFKRRHYPGGYSILSAECRGCYLARMRTSNRDLRDEHRRAELAEQAARAERFTRTWTRPPSDAHWGYCSDERIWTHGNGRCHCGAEWVEVVQIAPMYENLVRG